MAEFTVVAQLDEVPPGRASSFTVAEKQIAVFNVDGTVYAMDDSCQHKGSQACEEAEFVIVADGLTPIGMEPRNERLGLLQGKRIDGGAVLLGDSQTGEARGRVVLLRVILVAVIEGAANHADRVVVRLRSWRARSIGSHRKISARSRAARSARGAWRTPGPIANAIKLEIELDALAPKGTHATLYGFAAHRAFLKLAPSWQLDEVSDGRDAAENTTLRRQPITPTAAGSCACRGHQPSGL